MKINSILFELSRKEAEDIIAGLSHILTQSKPQRELAGESLFDLTITTFSQPLKIYSITCNSSESAFAFSTLCRDLDLYCDGYEGVLSLCDFNEIIAKYNPEQEEGDPS